MGYNVRIIASTLTLPWEYLPEILERWKDLNKPENNSIKNGGSYSGGKQTNYWFSWMDENYDQTCDSVEDILEMLGFDGDPTMDGDIRVTSYDGKTGQEDIFFRRIADLIPEGQSVTWLGEDDDLWQWKFTGTGMNQAKAQINF